MTFRVLWDHEKARTVGVTETWEFVQQRQEGHEKKERRREVRSEGEKS